MEQTNYVAGYFAFGADSIACFGGMGITDAIAGPLEHMVDVNPDNQMMTNGTPNSLGLQYINVQW